MATTEHEAKKIVSKRARQEIADFVDENIKQLVARLWDLAAATKKAGAPARAATPASRSKCPTRTAR
jgi:hypothetical protein